jgi:hypothetical protein
MASNGKPQFAKQIFQSQAKGGLAAAVNAAVGQDKARIASARPASPQPAADNHTPRAKQLNRNTPRATNGNVAKSSTVHLDLWVDPIVKAELQRIARQEGLSVSATGAAFLKQALQHNVDMHYSALLEPIIISAIRKAMQGYGNRFAWLLARNIFASEQTRGLATNILGKQPGMTEEKLKTILDMTKRAAQGSLTRRNPEA